MTDAILCLFYNPITILAFFVKSLDLQDPTHASVNKQGIGGYFLCDL